MTIRFLLVVVLLLHSSGVTCQQQVFFQEKQRIHILLRSSDGDNRSLFIFQKLAEGQNRPLSSVELTVSFEQNLRVFRSTRIHVTSSFEGRDFKADGDVFYRGFDMRQVLLPDEMSVVTTLSLPGSDLPSTATTMQALIRNGETGRIEKKHVDSTHSTWKLDAAEHRFYFRKDAQDRFRERTDKVNAYYQASAQLEPLRIRLQTVQPLDIDRILFQHENLLSIEAELSRMEASHFVDDLDLRSTDPLRFLPRYEALFNEVLTRRMAINETRRTLFLHFYNAGLDMQARGRRAAAKEYFGRSLQDHPLFAPAAYQLARMDFADGCTDDAAALALDILQRMQPDPDIRRLDVQLLYDIYDQYLEDASRLNSQKKFERSLVILDKARNLCRQTSHIRCDDSMESSFRIAHAGVYNGWLEESRQYFQQGKMDPAEEAVREALRYQKKNAAYIVSASEALSLQHSIRQKRYDILFATGSTHMKQHFYDKALLTFRDADTLLARYGLAPAPGSDSLKKEAARQVILSGIQRGNEYALANNLGEARKVAKEAAVMQEQYGLTTDPVIAPRLSSLKQAIFSQECVNAQAAYDAQAQRMHEAIRKKEYTTAHTLYQQADRLLKDNADCSLQEGNLRAQHDSILPAYVYQEMLQGVLGMQSNGRFAEAAAKFAEAEKYYFQFGVSEFGLNHPGIVRYADDHFSNEFIVFLGNNLRSRKEYDQSLALYKMLAVRKVPARRYNDGLYQLGVELALRDRALQTAADPKQKVLDYTGGDKLLKKFGKGYQKGWKMRS